MIARATALLAAGALLTAAQAVLPGEPRRPAASWITNLTRPFALPPLWRDLASATAEGRSADATAAARRIADFLPSWSDGTAMVGWLVAFDEAADAPDPEAAAERVLTAVTWLEDRAAERAARDPRVAADLLGTAATIAEAAFARRPDAARAAAEQGAPAPAELAADLLGRAASLDPSHDRAERRALATLRAATTAVRLGDMARAAAALDAAHSQLRATGTEFARRLATALDAIPDLAALAADPSLLERHPDLPPLGELAEALRAREVGR